MAYDDRETGLTVEDRGSKLGLPQNQDAEANVLAAMLLSPEVVEEAQVELQPDDFYRPIHKTIYTAMVDMSITCEASTSLMPWAARPTFWS